MNGFLDDLASRGLLYQKSPGIEEAFNKGAALYLGYDPTGPDLHIGHLLGLTVLKRALRYGQRIIILVGGGTSLIGDPGGKDVERPILPKETIEANKESLKQQFSRFFTFDNELVRMVDNADWLSDVKLVDFLREVGKYIPVNTMLDKDSVKSRISREEGISYAEFSYQLLQAYDYMQLYKQYGCNVQIGGSDQWGNIVQGVELIRKRLGKEAFALSFPLIVNPKTGRKFGKSESGESIWLNPKKTHPYAFYQFFLNTEDDMAPMLMRFYSFRELPDIESIIARWEEARHERLLQKELAWELTALAHGEEAARQASEVASLLFSRRGAELTVENIEFIRAAIPSAKLSPGAEFCVERALFETGLAASMSEARRLVAQNGVTVDKLYDKYYLMRKGKKDYALVLLDQ